MKKEDSMAEKISYWKQLGDGTTWPLPEWMLPEDDSVEWQLRYGNPTRNQLMRAASIISAYGALIRQGNKRRNEICNKLKD